MTIILSILSILLLLHGLIQNLIQKIFGIIRNVRHALTSLII
jgi:hypothetical protein